MVGVSAVLWVGGHRLVTASVKRRRRPPAKKKRSSIRPLLAALSGEEARLVLEHLLDAYPDLVAEANRFAKSVLSQISSACVADDVEAAIRSLDLEDLGGRAGRHEWGYVSPTEAASELLEEAVEPFIDDMKRHVELGLEEEGLEIAKGILVGLYRLREAKNGYVLEWAPDSASEHALHVICAWSEASGARPRGRDCVCSRLLEDFVDEALPDWTDMIDRSPSRTRRRPRRR